jgi:hypothetical protein
LCAQPGESLFGQHRPFVLPSHCCEKRRRIVSGLNVTVAGSTAASHETSCSTASSAIATSDTSPPTGIFESGGLERNGQARKLKTLQLCKYSTFCIPQPFNSCPSPNDSHCPLTSRCQARGEQITCNVRRPSAPTMSAPSKGCIAATGARV